MIILKHLFHAIHDCGDGVLARRDTETVMIYFDSAVIAKKQKVVIETRNKNKTNNTIVFFLFYCFFMKSVLRFTVTAATD